MSSIITNEILSIATYSLWACLLAAAMIGGLTGWFLRGTPQKKLNQLNEEWSDRYADLELECDRYRAELQSSTIPSNHTNSEKMAELIKKYKFLLNHSATLEKKTLQIKKELQISQDQLRLSETHLAQMNNTATASHSSLAPTATSNTSTDDNTETNVQLLKSSLNSSEQELNHIKIKLNSHLSEKMHLSNELSNKDLIIQKLEKQLKDTLKSQEASLDKTQGIDWYKKEIDQQQVIINQQKQDITQQLALYDSLRNELSEATHKLKKTEQHLEQSKSELTNELSQRDQLIEKLNTQITQDQLKPLPNNKPIDKSDAAVRSLESYIDNNPLASESQFKKKITSNNSNEKIASLHHQISQLEKNLSLKDEEISLCMKLLEDKNAGAQEKNTALEPTPEIKTPRSDSEIHTSINNFFSPETKPSQKSTRVANQSHAPNKKTVASKPNRFDTTSDKKPSNDTHKPTPTSSTSSTSSTHNTDIKTHDDPFFEETVEPKKPNTKPTVRKESSIMQKTAHELEALYGKTALSNNKKIPKQSQSTPPVASTNHTPSQWPDKTMEKAKKTGMIELDSLLSKKSDKDQTYRAPGIPHKINIRSNQGMDQDVSHLLSITGLDRRTAELLHQSDIPSILILSQLDADAVIKKITPINKEKKIVNELPPKTRLNQWIKQAQLMVKNNH